MGGTPATGLARLGFWVVAGALLAVALARPQWGELPAEESVRTRDLALVIDVSDSMLCPDLRPSRLARSLEVIKRMLPALEGNRVGVVVFAGEAYPLVPLTTDLSAVAVFLDGIHPGMVALPGSNLQAASAAALKLMPPDGEGRVLVLLTDGENLQGNVDGAAQALRDAGVGVLAVVAGTEAGGPIPVLAEDGSLSYKRDAGGQPVVTRAQPDVLRSIAEVAGGKVLNLEDQGVDAQLVAAIDELRTREIEASRTVQRVERFPVFLALAALALTMGFVLRPWRRLAVACLIVGLSPAGFASAQQMPDGEADRSPSAEAQSSMPKPPWWQRLIPGGSRRLARSGAANFEDGELDKAVRDFAAATALDPDAPDRLFDLGTALAATGQVEPADALLQRAHEAGVEGAAYNGGTASLSVGQAQRAVELLREALLASPDDPDVKRNYELALRQLEEQQQQQQQDEQQQDQDQPETSPTPSPSPGEQPPAPTPTPQNEPLYSALDRAEADARETMKSPTPRSTQVEKDW
jgi:Ca-activated chloride channel family protein